MDRPFRFAAPIATLLAMLIMTAGASAQAPSRLELERARAAFRDGAEAVQAGRWEQAVDSFQRSYELVANPVTLLNLSGARIQAGQLVAGAEGYRRLLGGPLSGLAPGQRAAAARALSETEARIPRLRLGLEGLHAGDEVTLDGERVPWSAIGAQVPLDPGTHLLRVVRDGDERLRVPLVLQEGEVRDLELEVPRPTPAPAPATADLPPPPPSSAGSPVPERPPQPPVPLPAATDRPPIEAAADPPGQPLRLPQHRSLLRSPWLWTGVAAVVVIGLATGLALALSGSPEAYGGSLGGPVTVR
jgi:hypothetical protein